MLSLPRNLLYTQPSRIKGPVTLDRVFEHGHMRNKCLLVVHCLEFMKPRENVSGSKKSMVGQAIYRSVRVCRMKNYDNILLIDGAMGLVGSEPTF